MTAPTNATLQGIVFWTILLLFAYFGYRAGRTLSLWTLIVIIAAWFLFLYPTGQAIALRFINTSWRFAQVFIQVLQNGGSLAGVKTNQLTDLLKPNTPDTQAIFIVAFLLLAWLAFTQSPNWIKKTSPSLEGALIGLVTGYALLTILAPVFNIQVGGPIQMLNTLGTALTTGIGTNVIKAPAAPAGAANSNTGASAQSKSSSPSVLVTPVPPSRSNSPFNLVTPVPPRAATAQAASAPAQGALGNVPAPPGSAPSQASGTLNQAPTPRLLGVLDSSYLVVGVVLLILFLAAMSLNPVKPKK